MVFANMGSNWKGVGLFLLSLSALIDPVVSVKYENFKKCDQSGFCKRNRAYADTVKASGVSFKSPYTLDGKTVVTKDGSLSATLSKTLEGGQPAVLLPLTIEFLHNGAARVRIDEDKRRKKDVELRHNSQARKERYDGVSYWALTGEPAIGKSTVKSKDADSTTINYGPEDKFQAVVHHSPFWIEFLRDGETHVKLNSDNLFNFEHWRPKVEKAKEEGKEGEEAAVDNGPDESTWWEETFGGNTDSKPRGPESVAMDVTFPGYSHVFGIPEHTGPLSLRETRGGGDDKFTEPYRMYNSDVFEYEMNSPMTLYGSIPFMQAHRKGSTVGVFWLNAAETWVDITKDKKGTQSHWISETGVLDVFVFLGPTPQDVIGTYSDLTGTTTLPQEFSIAYHQCRWNYISDEDVKDVDRRFDRADIPYDIIWLDIEYTDGKKYFTWDPDTFPQPLGMEKQLDERQRKLVIIIDPHIKNTNDYPIVEELKSQGLAVNDKENKLWEGWCWPGSSHWIDCFNPASIKWWISQFDYKKFAGTLPNVHIWNDMNEPSVFNGPETTMPKDNLHYGLWEHRDVHNVNGLTFVNATYRAMVARDQVAKRPFILTRSFYAGSQRTGAMWTGDNQARWDHLKASIPMVLANGIAGFPFAGADVGGFFGNPAKDLLTRWYQAGIWYPFFRAHAHIDTRRREPYMIGAPYTDIITQSLRLRYSLMPAWYTAFHESSRTGAPIVRPNYYVHPDDEAGFTIDGQLYLGSFGVLARPTMDEGAEHSDVYLADDQPYYDYFDYTVYQGAGKRHRVPTPLERSAVLLQGGHVIPRKDRPRRSSGLMRYDPYTLVVALDKTGKSASGELYVDDGESFDYQDGGYIWRTFSFDDGKFTSKSHADAAVTGKKTAAFAKKMDGVTVEKIVVVGAPKEWKGKEKVKVGGDGATKSEAGLTWTDGGKGRASWAVVRNPAVKVGRDFEIDFS